MQLRSVMCNPRSSESHRRPWIWWNVSFQDASNSRRMGWQWAVFCGPCGCQLGHSHVMLIVLWIEAIESQAELEHCNKMKQYDNEANIEYCLGIEVQQRKHNTQIWMSGSKKLSTSCLERLGQGSSIPLPCPPSFSCCVLWPPLLDHRHPRSAGRKTRTKRRKSRKKAKRRRRRSSASTGHILRYIVLFAPKPL